MRFNPEKCTFGVRAGKFLGFYLTERGIEANPDKFRAFSELPTPNNKKSIQVLNGMLTALSCFVVNSAQHALPFLSYYGKKRPSNGPRSASKHYPILSKYSQSRSFYPDRALTRFCISTWPSQT